MQTWVSSIVFMRYVSAIVPTLIIPNKGVKYILKGLDIFVWNTSNLPAFLGLFVRAPHLVLMISLTQDLFRTTLDLQFNLSGRFFLNFAHFRLQMWKHKRDGELLRHRISHNDDHCIGRYWRFIILFLFVQIWMSYEFI